MSYEVTGVSSLVYLVHYLLYIHMAQARGARPSSFSDSLQETAPSGGVGWGVHVLLSMLQLGCVSRITQHDPLRGGGKYNESAAVIGAPMQDFRRLAYHTC